VSGSLKLSLKTTLLLIALVSVLFAWHAERSSRSNISGSWVYHPSDSTLNWTSVQFEDTLTIDSDGSFIKQQKHGLGSHETYEGNWHTDQSGMTTFHVTKVSRGSVFEDEKIVKVDYRFLCRCTVDSFGFLVTNEHLALREYQEFNEETTNVRWRSYRRRTLAR
jgi:hypothetical protein